MKPGRSGYFTLLAAFFVSALHASAAQEPTPTTARLLPLWKVEGEKSAVFLLGSVHVLKENRFPLPAPIEAAFTDAEVAMFETEIGKMESPETVMKIMSRSRLPAGKTLPEVLPQDVYTNLVAHAKAAGVPPAILDGLVPPMAAITLLAVELQKMGFNPEHGVDRHFFNRAVEAQKEIIPLETLDFQIDLMTKFSEEEAVQFVKTTLEEFDIMTEEVEGLVAAWETGDADSLEKYLNEADRKAPALFKRLVSDRNERWLPQIEKLARGDKQAIVIVGAAHLVGPDGVVSLLQKRGLKVTQVRRPD